MTPPPPQRLRPPCPHGLCRPGACPHVLRSCCPRFMCRSAGVEEEPPHSPVLCAAQEVHKKKAMEIQQAAQAAAQKAAHAAAQQKD